MTACKRRGHVNGFVRHSKHVGQRRHDTTNDKRASRAHKARKASRVWGPEDR